MIRALRRLRQDLGIMAEASPDPGYGGLAAFVEVLRGSLTAAGIRITPDKALSIPTVAGCVRIHSEAVGRLPIKVYRRLPDGGKERAPDHPYSKLLKIRPNGYQTAAEWKSLNQADVETYGNAYNLKVVINGELREILPIEAKRMEVTRSPSGEASYKVYDDSGTSLKRTYTAGSILHFRGPFGNSLVAKSPSDQYRELFAIAYAIEMFIGSSFRNGIRPSVAFATDKTLGEAARANLENWLANDFAGSDKASIGMILDDGLKPIPFSPNNEQGQVAELSDKVDLKIARVYTMPPHMLGFNLTLPRANMEQQAKEYIEQGLGSRVERMEQRLNVELFDGGEDEFFCEFQFDDLLKGDPATRADFYSKLVNIGVMTQNECRARENLNPKDGGDDLLTPKNMNQGPANGQPDQGGPPPPPQQAPGSPVPATQPSKAEDRAPVSVYVNLPPSPAVQVVNEVAAPSVEILAPITVMAPEPQAPAPPAPARPTRKRVLRDGEGRIEVVIEEPVPGTGKE